MKKYDNIIELYFKSYNMFNLFENEPRDFETGDLLYSTEIHTVVAIGKNPGMNLTRLAECMGVSKSAVSKFINKLLRKKYVIKSQAIDNQKEVLFNLTPKGKIAFDGHEKFAQIVFGGIYEIFEKSSENELEVVENVLRGIIDVLEKARMEV